MENLTKGLLVVAGAVGVSAVLAARSRRAQAAENAQADDATNAASMQHRPLPATLDAASVALRADILGVAQVQLDALSGAVNNDPRGTLGPDTRAAFDAWRAAHPTTGPGDIGVIASLDDVYRAGHGLPAVTSAPLGR